MPTPASGAARPDDQPSCWQAAASCAARAHRPATRKDGVTPYIAHPFRVAMTIRHIFGHDDDITLAAAMLHDTIEDTGADYDEIAEQFGPEVASLVAALTKNMALPEPEREAAYDRQLAGADWRARLIKLADQYDNLCDAMTGDASRARSLEKARRAIQLAEVDRAARPEAQRALEALRQLIAKAPSALP
jgi:guanosine-3',5'-bis(diphosphate) 3'-pyrophosphohydrolase